MSGILAPLSIKTNKNTMEMKTPLRLVQGETKAWIEDAAGNALFFTNPADAAGIIACVNACAGIPIEKLEGKTIADYVASETYVTGIKDGQLGLAGIGPSMIASSFAGMLEGSKAQNYLELSFEHPSIGGIMVTVQRVAGKTPHQLRTRAEEQRDQLLAALYKALPFVEDHKGNPVYKPGAVDKCIKEIREAIDAAEKGAA